MKFRVFILSLLLLEAVCCAEEAVLMTQSIEDLLKDSLKAPAQTCQQSGNSTLESLFSADHSFFDSKKICENEKKECIPVTLAAVCEQSREQVWTRYRDDTLEQNANRRRSRFQSKELRRKIFSYAQNEFTKIKENPVLQSRCCPSEVLKTSEALKKCVSFFTSTQLYLLKGLSKEDMTADYQGFREDPLVEISEARLLYCKNQECIDDVLLHELGHACQYSRGDILELFRCQAPQKILEKDLTIFFGKDATKCILKDLKPEFKDYVNSSKKHKEKPCLNRWVHETFADLIFMDQRKTPAAFYGFCDFKDKVDSTHGPTFINDCVMNQSPYREALCGSESECDRSKWK